MKIQPAQTYQDGLFKKVSVDAIRSKLKLKQIKEQLDFEQRFPHAHKFLKTNGIDLSRVREHSSKLIGAGILTGALLLAHPDSLKPLSAPREIVKDIKDLDLKSSNEPIQKSLLESLKETLPAKPRALTREEEKKLEMLFNETLGVNSKANLEGEHLNTTYGYIGAEQHLRRYPGDTIGNHGSLEDQKEGIAPGLGAWGYFAYSRDKMTPDVVEKEKWYAVVQTLYLPDWKSRQPYLANWYKYRKVLIVNTVNGNAVVADIADAGPAAWTGKQFGGSPEVMDYLGGPRYKKGAVVIFFVDDPQNKVPLGPVEYNEISKLGVSFLKT